MDKQNQQQEKKRARVIAAIYTIIMVALLFLLGFYKQDPPPEEEGIMVNFGYMDAAAGMQEPSQNQPTPTEQESPPEPVEASTPEVEEVSDLNQDIEETVTMDEEPAPEPEPEPVIDPKPKPEPTPVEPTKEVAEKVKEQPIKEAPPIEEPVIDDNALFTGFSKEKNNSPGEGIDEGEGNQGQPDGGEGDSYVPGPSSTGNSGVGAELTGRKMVKLPWIDDSSQKTGAVRLKVVVDNTGRVIDAKFTAFGSTTHDQELINKAIRAAKYDTQFSPGERDFQSGYMTFTFKLK